MELKDLVVSTAQFSGILLAISVSAVVLGASAIYLKTVYNELKK